jgi:hypothetical protein
MKRLETAVLIIALAALANGCNPADKTQQESTVKTTTPDGSATTKTKTEQVGSTSVSTSETQAKGSTGAVKTQDETIVGTVSKFEAAKKLEVITGDNEKHSFDLSSTKVSTRVDPAVVVGSKVTVVQHTDADGNKTLEVRLQAA